MACVVREVPGRLEPCSVTWGRKHCRTITAVADVASSLNNTYADLNAIDTSVSAFTEKQYYYWFNIAAAGSDPAPGGTGIEIAVAAGASAATIVAAMKVAIDLLDDFDGAASVSGDTIIIQNQKIGLITAETDSGATGFTYATNVSGVGGDLGDSSGGITFNMETTSVEIKSDQKGDLLLDEVFSGASLSIDMSLLEMSAANWALLVGEGTGANFTPSGGTEVTGMGTEKVFKNATNYAGELVLKPLSTVAGDNSRNITFWLCLPMASSINYSGTDVQAMDVSFKAYFDPSKDTNINMFVFGDSTQTGFGV